MFCVFAIFSFYAHFAILPFFLFSDFLNFHFSLKLFLICSYFSGDLSLTVLIKCVLNFKKSVILMLYTRRIFESFLLSVDNRQVIQAQN